MFWKILGKIIEEEGKHVGDAGTRGNQAFNSAGRALGTGIQAPDASAIEGSEGYVRRGNQARHTNGMFGRGSKY